MIEKNKFLGCFTSGPAIVYDASKTEHEKLQELNQKSKIAESFRHYISSENGISYILKKLKSTDYGQDIAIILFQFYLYPLPYELQHLESVEGYRKNEKSFGLSIIVNDENFFSKTEGERYDFLKEAILKKIDLLAEIVKKKKLDTNVVLLKSDLENAFK